ncbi:hypothetical protein BU26DRAFT_154261 [Trematosphaeria pertusa]|uniref:Uncharacterized protein n=1 Tax=Trematosphaeria pertusa TaxID=390896 RepID=A0A6A6IXY4_9PLEO|nr:uncharacterized protein BU26DRAFT_154261 [Trematosphaeria pertusa]KAF2255349.1 hypothetical protein BU26DRAFT_154261 [Trematosphaeria pertusa]
MAPRKAKKAERLPFKPLKLVMKRKVANRTPEGLRKQQRVHSPLKRSKRNHRTKSPRRRDRREKAGFFQLPREIRDMVYHELWKQTPAIDVRGSLVTAFYRISTNEGGDNVSLETPATKLPLGLLACKSMLKESLEQFRRNGLWYVHIGSGDPLPRIQSSMRSSHFRELGITYGILKYTKNYNPGFRTATFSGHLCDEHSIDRLSEYFSASTTIEKLALQVYLCYPDIEKSQLSPYFCRIKVDLSVLDGLKKGFSHLTAFEIVVMEFVDLFIPRQCLEKPLVEEVMRLGRKVMGKGVLSTVQKTPITEPRLDARGFRWRFAFEQN